MAADADQDACQTYRENLGVECDALDLATDTAVRSVEERVGRQAPFIVVGSPPCQGFSTAGPRNAADPRNRLIFSYLALISRLRPKWCFFENVEGLLTSNEGQDIVSLAFELISLGYTIRIEKINFAGYGLAQTRKRVVIIGNRLGHFFDIPPAIFSFNSGKSKSYRGKSIAPSLLDAIADLPDPMNTARPLAYNANHRPTAYAAALRSDSGTVSHHLVTGGSNSAAIAWRLKPGQTMKDLPAALQHESYARRANRRVSDGTPTEGRGGAPAGVKRLRGDLNALTITSASPREFIHPTADRPLTLRECARLQSFPDSFNFTGKGVSIARQIGNAVPPLAARVLAEAIMTEDGRAGADVGSAKGQVSGLIGFRLTDASGVSPALARTEAALRNLMAEDELPMLRRRRG